MKRTSSFVAITTEGGLLPADFLAELLSPKANIDGLTPTSYNLADGERINEQVNRSWNRLKGRWADFKKAILEKSADEFTTTETRNRWLQPLFQELGYGQRLSRAKPIEIDGKSYPVSHAWNHLPMHLVGAHVDLDHRTPGIVGAAKASPHSLVQQLLNASDAHLWGIVSNGLNLRLLRDNIALTRQSLVEWDLAAIFDGDLYSEFFLLWIVLHQSRFDAERPEQCWIEKWKKKSEDKGLRALDRLQIGVARSIEALGVGFLSHPANKTLRLKLSKGELTTQDFYRQILRIIYRLIFLLVAEERELLHLPLSTHEDKDIVDSAIRARQRYHDFYSVGRLRKLTLARAGTPHSDLWQTFQCVAAKLGSNVGCPELALTALGSYLWDAARSTPDLNDALVSNYQFITAIHALTFMEDGAIRRFVDYKNLGTEELGSVYEGLLELRPIIDSDEGTFKLNEVSGNERKTSGSYYTPDSLVQCLLGSALDPVIDEALCGKEGSSAVDALLNLKICDPASGSGHFLIAASHRLAKHVAAARTGEDEPSPTAIRKALRDVIGRCIYGVDINPMAVELCKVSLWMEAVEPGKPLSFLDHHIQCGNSLLGTTPALFVKGIPDDAFKPIKGDDAQLCTEYRRQNKRERQQETLLGFHGETWEHLGYLTTNIAQIANLPDDSLEEVQAKEQKYAALVASTGYELADHLSNAWCAAFVWKKCASTAGGFRYPITNGVFRHLESEPHVTPEWVHGEVKRLAAQYNFFHWHLAFPDVFQVPPSGRAPENELCGWNGGFDVILGNPPWERVKLQEKEWFAAHGRWDIANTPNAASRKRLIAAVKNEEPLLFNSFCDALRAADGESHLLRNTGLYPLCGRGDINLYAVFAELMRNHLTPRGRLGAVLPNGIATGNTTRFFFQDLVHKYSLVSILSFFEIREIFLGTDSREPFCLLTAGSGACRVSEEAVFVFHAKSVEDVFDPARRFTLTSDDFALLKPNTQTCPVFGSERDAELTKAVYRRVPILDREGRQPVSPWGILIRRVFDMNRQDVLAVCVQEKPRELNRWRPMFEAKLMQQFDSRFASYIANVAQEVTSDEKKDPSFRVHTRYWIPSDKVEDSLLEDWRPNWLLAWRDITNTGSERSVIACILPRVGTDFTLRIGFPFSVPTPVVGLLAANFNAVVFDYCARQSLSGNHLADFIIKQLPVLPPTVYAQLCAWEGRGRTVEEWLTPRVLELTYTAWDLEAFAQDCGWKGGPFRWDEERRFLLQCELDAAFFHLYGLDRADAAYILDTFPLVRRKDEEKYKGDYRTKRVILEIYDAMQTAIARSVSYNTVLDPPPPDLSLERQANLPSLPLVLPPGLRFAQPEANIYVLRVILSMLKLMSNRIEMSTLMNACALLVKPERLATFAENIEQNVIAAWRNSFSDRFEPTLFLPTIDELVRRGELRLERENQKFIVMRIGTMNVVKDPYIEFDALLALRVEDSLSEIQKQSIMPMASPQDLEVRFKVA